MGGGWGTVRPTLIAFDAAGCVVRPSERGAFPGVVSQYGPNGHPPFGTLVVSRAGYCHRSSWRDFFVSRESSAYARFHLPAGGGGVCTPSNRAENPINAIVPDGEESGTLVPSRPWIGRVV